MASLLAITVHHQDLALAEGFSALSITARRFSSNPESMAILAILTGMFSVAVGLSVSLHYDTPFGPSIVSAAALCLC